MQDRAKTEARQSQDRELKSKLHKDNYSATGTRTRVARVRAEYPNQLDYSGAV